MIKASSLMYSGLLMLLLTSQISASEPNLAVSDTTIGNGGDLVMPSANSYFLLDLYEAGLERNPYFDSTVQTDEKIAERIHAAIPLEAMALNLLAAKLTEITQRDRLLGHALLRAAELLRWRLVNYELLNVPDEGTVYKGELFQGAIRQGFTVFIQSQLWRSLPANNRAALLLHELIYALYAPEDYISEQKVQRSYRVREINAQFFSPDWNLRLEETYRVINAALPTNANSGFLEVTKDEFQVTPYLFVMDEANLSSPILFKPEVGIDEATRINWFCEKFSWNQDLELKSRAYQFGWAARWVKLTRNSYNSPLGILDYIQWKNSVIGDRWQKSDYDLLPYNNRIGEYPKKLHPGEVFNFFSHRVIYDFKGKHNEELQKKAKAACLAYLRDELTKYGSFLDTYK